GQRQRVARGHAGRWFAGGHGARDDQRSASNDAEQRSGHDLGGHAAGGRWQHTGHGHVPGGHDPNGPQAVARAVSAKSNKKEGAVREGGSGRRGRELTLSASSL